MSASFWLSDEQWQVIEPHLPMVHTGPERVDDRRVLSGIVHVLQSGCRWRDCPRAYGPYTTIYNRFNRWSRRGVWQQIFSALTGGHGPPGRLMVDSSTVKAHRSASGGKGGKQTRPSGARAAVGRQKFMR